MFNSLLLSFGTYFKNLWMNLFGTSEAGGLNIGFWFSMIVCVILVIIMNLVFWLMKPKGTKTEDKKDDSGRSKENGEKR